MTEKRERFVTVKGKGFGVSGDERFLAPLHPQNTYFFDVLANAREMPRVNPLLLSYLQLARIEPTTEINPPFTPLKVANPPLWHFQGTTDTSTSLKGHPKAHQMP